MFLLLLLATFLISTAVATVVALLFRPAIASILQRVLVEPISAAWVRYLLFAIYVVGISSGVRIWDLEKYITPQILPEPAGRGAVLTLNTERWVLEVYRTVIGTLQGVAWLLLVFFVFALIAFVIVRLAEIRSGGKGERPGAP